MRRPVVDWMSAGVRRLFAAALAVAGLAGCTQVTRDCRDCPVMRRIPAPEAASPAAAAARASLWMGQYEITVAQFDAFAKATSRPLPTRCFIFQDVKSDGSAVFGWVNGASYLNPGYAQTRQHPAVCISWDDSVAYASWLSARTGRTYRLPTEAEIDHATRASTRTRYFWGDDLQPSCQYANVADRSLQKRYPAFTAVTDCDDGDAFTAEVGRHQPNPYGLYDLLGNAWEWTADCAEAAAGSPPCRQRVRRGGSWYRVGEEQRSALPAADAHGNAGFRLVRER